MNVTWSSLTEPERLKIEQGQTTVGKQVLSSQIWRDGEFIPDDPDPIFNVMTPTADNDFLSISYSRNYGATVLPILKKCIEVPLSRVIGTLNVYAHDALKDALDEKFGENYLIKLVVNGVEISHSVGHPHLDPSAGYIVFKDDEFSKELGLESKITATFYKYIGRKGFFGSSGDEIGITYPFADDKPLLKSAQNDEHLALFKVKGGHGTSYYILPPTNTKYYKRSEDEQDMHVIMTQENMNDIIDTIGIVNGGYWL